VAVIAGVVLENTMYHFDKIFDYIIPQEFIITVKSGMRVLVPFGRGNKTTQGMVMYVQKADDTTTEGYKSITQVLDLAPVLTTELLGLVSFMKDRYYCRYYDCVKAMLPVGINYKISCVYTAVKGLDTTEITLSPTEDKIIAYVLAQKKPVKRDELLLALQLEDNSVIPDKMVKKGILIKEGETNRRVNDAMLKMVRLKDNPPNCKLTPKQNEVVEILQMAGAVSVKEICYFTGTTAAVVNALVKKAVAVYFNQEIFRTPKRTQVEKDNSEIVLTPQQQTAYEDLLNKYRSGEPNVSLLYGVTGSGKTSVFMKVIDQVYKDNKGVILMVPEISLTPQLINLFRGRYGDDVAVFHSGLSLGERLDEWKRVKNGLAKIAIGTRSAVFAPFDNLGFVIMDEEQEYTYKSETTPRYNARDVAKYRCNSNKCLLLLSSATPSVETFYSCTTGRYSINTLTQRYGTAKLPDVVVADMNIEQDEGNTTGISSVLLQGLEDNLSTGRQSILLLNRRGYNTFVACRSCKEVVACPHCSISLTYHSANNRLMCHYCGYSQDMTDECPVCHSHGLRFSGMGTQKATEMLSELLPNARILRLDTDTTMAKYSHEEKLTSFANGAYDIMIGTQMVAKGLNFPNVTLVGVLSIDQMLYNDDYRSFERTFALLTQVVGRSGRGKLKGRAIIQTFTPENPTIMLAAKQDYDKFYSGEIAMRRAMLYPPYADICMIGFVGQNQDDVEKAAFDFTKDLVDLAQSKYSDIPLRVLGSTPAAISKVNNKFRYKTVLKFRNSKKFREMLSKLLCDFGRDSRYLSVTAYADINPDSIL